MMSAKPTLATIDTMLVAGPAPPRRVRYFALVVIFVALTVVLACGLHHAPRKIPSTFIGKPIPQFNLPPVKGRLLGLSTPDLEDEVSLVNVFASWCAACREEHPLLLKLKADDLVPVHGLDYKDPPDDAA